MEGIAVAREEEKTLIRRDYQRGPHLVEILLHPEEGSVPDGDHAVLSSFALPHEQEPALCIEVIDAQPGQLPSPKAGGVEGL